ncbi:hypothetical protein VOLCADRAFT_59982 [Volvox carteri f. nagariensis]|uniref:glycine--tRNA ligase n=1 Tax=Volvox carteri f. nagariensis TaxID=3068 RepID=D8TUY8_VOLCA|nr:uncharacterized protein VOLCADRAFT_59982 [Volvox carteri f. nagariensis]EFJ48902.1 hypothetical protein VOLCADRAFT_59982 [Volvox carteri f. nagariensis]|eukprot:XP_002950234.1 hypothetical protein VOLCADRAFT_59982 [Volvox carteri f. nagariensis]
MPHAARSLIRASAASPAATAAPNPIVVAASPAPNNGSNGQTTQPSGLVKDAPTFQEAISKLQEYWASVGCAIWLPHNTEVGAGTMNPATFLRVLGPEPWNVAYAEPSIRPDDSRYGDNPNRLQRHTQFQVILKPDPGNAQELYLGSLEALGIDTKVHDVRFVEDNWESPVLGAWGLGWEVWLDGMEVTQFTYFQQAGGRALDAPAVEITYGLERIMMSLQGVTNFKDIRYAPGVTYGEMFYQNEYEMSCYNLDEADVADQRARFELYDKEARRLLAKRLPIPAYDHLLKLSHTFNILDARGAVGVTERADCFATLRGLAREITGLWVSRREELGHPLGLIPPPASPVSSRPVGAPLEPRSFVLEIGTEELPPDDVVSALNQLRERVPALLSKLRLTHGSVHVEGTPRRLAVVVEGLAARQASEEAKVRGPPAKQAFSADGSPTKALEGFCRKNGVDVGSVTREADAKGVEYVYAVVRDAGRDAVEVLTDELPGLVGSLSFKKSMRWNGHGASFSRPMRWLLALHGDVVLPFVYGGLQAARTTRVLRNSPAPELVVSSAETYLPALATAGIALSGSDRAEAIWRDVEAAAANVGRCPPILSPPSSPPCGLCNSTSPPFPPLPLPGHTFTGGTQHNTTQHDSEVLVMVMRKHQRYFPVFAPDGKSLLPYFITVANGPVDPAVVAAGNEAVLRARFEDATFFYREDLKQPLEAFRPKLSGTTFQKDLGSLLDKALRLERLVGPLAAAVAAARPGQAAWGEAGVLEVAVEAARLCKADLATSTVTEMTALAGTMGRHYAYKQASCGLSAAVAEAIFEAALPRQAGDLLPASPAGVLVAAADRLDSLVGLFAAGCAPTAAADPYGLRRAAYGMLQTLVTNNVGVSLRAAVAAAAALQPIAVSDAVQSDVLSYVNGRLEQLLGDGGAPAEVVRAVLGERGDDPALAAKTVEELKVWLRAGSLRRVMAAFSRPTRIVRGKEVPDASVAVDPAVFEGEEERQLYAAYTDARAKMSPAVSVSEWLAAVEPLLPAIDRFFDKVFVMCEDAAVRANRLALLRDLAALPRGVLDLSQLPGF